MGMRRGRKARWVEEPDRVVEDCRPLHPKRHVVELRGRVESKGDARSDARDTVRTVCCTGRYGIGGLVGERGESAQISKNAFVLQMWQKSSEGLTRITWRM